MSQPGLEVYVAFECARLERTLDVRGSAARAEYRLLLASATPRRVRFFRWLGVRLVRAGTWLCDRSEGDTSPRPLSTDCGQ